jgi:acetylornithine deacetylase/succinyl-diaminopimelate desuccinylase-like protein
MQSAAMLIVEGTRQDEPWKGRVLDLRVEDHPRPLEELRRVLTVQRAYDAANEGDEKLAKGDVAGALVAYARAEELLPEQVELSYWRATTLLDRGQQDEAFEILRRVFARDTRWVGMTPRVAKAGHVKADEAMLARIAALAPASDLRPMVAGADAARVERDVRILASFGTRHTLSAADGPKRGIGAARAWLRDELELVSRERHHGRLRVELASHRVEPGPRVPQGAEVVNVLATLPGSEPDRLVVLSGHYDSRASDPMDARSDAPGANDDASGVAAVLEAARLLDGLAPRASLVFMTVAGEEQGLLGSAAQSKQWKAEGKDVVAMITMDIVGGATGSDGVREPWRLRVFSEGVPSEGKVVGSDSDSSSRQLARYLERATEDAVPGFDVTLIFRQDRYLRGGDHRPFNALGWPAVRLTEPHENWDHQHQDVRVEDGRSYGDLPDLVDFAYVSRVAAAVAVTSGELALAPPSPRDVRLDVSKLSPHSRLTWSPGGGQPPAGYAILLRRTHEPSWTERRVVGGATDVTLENVSKDDWLFAVESFDVAGHRSLPVYPTPAP